MANRRPSKEAAKIHLSDLLGEEPTTSSPAGLGAEQSREDSKGPPTSPSGAVLTADLGVWGSKSGGHITQFCQGKDKRLSSVLVRTVTYQGQKTGPR